MNIRKIKLDDITRCYSTNYLKVNDELKVFFASEDPTSVCNCYSGENFENKELVWDDRGGCMSIIEVPNTNGEFLAVNEFYLKVSPSLSKLVWVKYVDGKWVIKDIMNLPYLHRFDIYNVDGVNYFIGATIAENKEDKEDWRLPGQIYVGVIPANIEEGIKIEKIADGMFRNHGYYRGFYDGRVCGYFTSDQGIVRVTPPSSNGEWKVEKILEGKISEIALVDIDGDGVEELMTIEPFHGNSMKIYKLKDGKYECDFVYPYEIDFAHTLVGTTLAGVSCFVGGVRRVNCELFYITYENNEYKVNIIESGVGPANVAVVNLEDKDLILSANHTKNEAAVYVVTK